MKFFVEKSKKVIIGGAVAGVICAGGVISLVAVCRARQAAAALFASASTVEQLQTVISRYPRSDAAASALLLLAAEQRRLGRLEESSVTYQRFLAAFPKHSLAPIAALGRAENTLVSGYLPASIAELQALTDKYPVSFVVPFSLYAQAELLTIQAGRIPEARERLQNLALMFPDSVFSRYSAKLLFLLNAQQVKE
jgi:outer membrane protein assembly factor BamD (BamD/ComL family)